LQNSTYRSSEIICLTLICNKASTFQGTVVQVTHVVAASRRRVHRYGSDESKWCCYLLCV